MKSLLCLLLSLFVVHGFLFGTSLRSKGGKVHESSSLWMNDVGPRSEHARALGTAKQVFSAASSVAVACTTVTELPVRVWADEKTKKKKKLKVKETDSGVKYVELKQGNGPFPNDGDYVSIVYTAYLNNGTIFDDTNVKGRKAVTFRLGQKQYIQGVEDVVYSMQPGAERTCTIPAALAYGSKGVVLPTGEVLVPPDETIRYFIKLKSVGAGFN